MKHVFKLSLTLGVICLCSATIIVAVNEQTRAARQRSEQQKLQKALNDVLPEFTNQPMQATVEVSGEEGRPVTFYRAKRDDDVIAVAGAAVSPKGYEGDVKVLTGLHKNGDIYAVVVTQHQETPGLGTQATDRKEQRSVWRALGLTGSTAEAGVAKEEKRKLAPNNYLDQYGAPGVERDGYNADEAPFKVEPDGGQIDAVSGATISSRAVADAVSKICKVFEKNKERILRSE